MSSHAEETPNVADRGGVAGPSALVLAEAGRGGLQPEAGHEPLPWRSPLTLTLTLTLSLTLSV